jgi:hypothetical protein
VPSTTCHRNSDETEDMPFLGKRKTLLSIENHINCITFRNNHSQINICLGVTASATVRALSTLQAHNILNYLQDRNWLCEAHNQMYNQQKSNADIRCTRRYDAAANSVISFRCLSCWNIYDDAYITARRVLVDRQQTNDRPSVSTSRVSGRRQMPDMR